MLALVLIGGVALAFNFIIILKKWEMKREEDAAFDLFGLIVMTLIFGGTLIGSAIAMVASAIFSLWLLSRPANILKSDKKKLSKDSGGKK